MAAPRRVKGLRKRDGVWLWTFVGAAERALRAASELPCVQGDVLRGGTLLGQAGVGGVVGRQSGRRSSASFRRRRFDSVNPASLDKCLVKFRLVQVPEPRPCVLLS